MTATEPLDPRVAELLSAYLDGAVTDEEGQVAAQWLERSPEARAEYESLAAVKAALGDLGEVDPPFGFYERMLRQGTPIPEVTSATDRTRRSGRHARWLAVGGAVAAAAAAFVVVAGAPETVTPPVSEVAAGTVGVPIAFRTSGEPAQALAQDADAVRWAELPEGERGTEGDAETWIDLTTEAAEVRVVVFEHGVVVTLSADDVDPAQLIDTGRELAEDEAADRGILDRLQDLAESIRPG